MEKARFTSAGKVSSSFSHDDKRTKQTNIGMNKRFFIFQKINVLTYRRKILSKGCNGIEKSKRMRFIIFKKSTLNQFEKSTFNN